MSALEVRDRRPWARLRRTTPEVKAAEQAAKVYKQWEDEFVKKLVQAKVKGVPMRFVEGDQATAATYYTLCEFNGAKIVFADINRDTGEGRRSAIVLFEGMTTLLHTGKKEMSGSYDPHLWNTKDTKESKILLENELGGLKAAWLYTADRVGAWKGYYPNAQEVLSQITPTQSPSGSIRNF